VTKVLKLFFLKVKESGCMKVEVLKVEDDVLLMEAEQRWSAGRAQRRVGSMRSAVRTVKGYRWGQACNLTT
jgi:hypothetical protein